MKDWNFDTERNLLGDWPRDEAGEPAAPAFLEHIFGSEPELMMERNMLLAYGIPSIASYPGDGTLGKVVLGVSGYGMDIFVPETVLEDARNILSWDMSEIDTENNNTEEEQENELP